MRGAGLRWLVLYLGCLLPCVASALDRDRALSQFYHTAWTVKDGAPGQVSALAQTADGYLWIAASSTLYRFDGVRFERYEPPAGQRLLPGEIVAISVSREGGLWLGYRFGGVSLLQEGRVTSYTADDGLPSGTVFGVATDADGSVWAAAVNGLARLERGASRWQQIDEDWGFGGGTARAVFADRDGTVWAAQQNSLVRLPRGARRFLPQPGTVGWVSRFCQAPDGTLWVAEGIGTVKPVAHADGSVPLRRPELRLSSAGIVFDRDGGLWVSSLGEGLRRIAHPERLDGSAIEAFGPQAEIFTEKEGLSGNYAWPVLEDREGNIWVGTTAGLDRFRTSKLVPAGLPSGSSDFALVPAEDGSLWAGTSNRPLMHLRDGVVTLHDIGERVTSGLRLADGRILLGARGGIWTIARGKPEKLAALPEGVSDTDVQTLLMDRHGVLWVSFNRQGIYRLVNGDWQRFEHAAIPRSKTALIGMAAADGRLWWGHTLNRILLVHGEDARLLSAESGLDLGNVTAFAEGAGRIWVGGERGLAYYDGRRFHAVDGAGPDSFRGVAAILDRGSGGLWLHALAGVFHIEQAEMRRALEQPGYRPRYRLLDFLDGLPAIPAQLRPLPSAVEDRHGRLWFATNNGVTRLDPQRLAEASLPPPVSIRSLAVEGRRYDPAPGLQLPRRTRNLQIDYTAPSLSIPERVRFRYRLEGLDEHWQEAGGRREAIYTNLAPGRYRFRVIAANHEGVWNETGAALDFEIPPAFFQTGWFRLLCALAAATLLWLLYQLRLRQMAARLQGRLEERLAERERIARELHDTLLQGIQGLILRFQALASRLGEAERRPLEDALERADRVLAEGRDRVHGLRESAGVPDDLERAFAGVGRELAQEYAAAFRLQPQGKAVELHPVVRDEVYRIGREALLNAFRHAEARTIEAELDYGRAELRLVVRDDGGGIDAAILDQGARAGHWGLRGMRERAQKIGGRLQLRSRAGGGTEVELGVPAAVAYAGRRARFWPLRPAGTRT